MDTMGKDESKAESNSYAILVCSPESEGSMAAAVVKLNTLANAVGPPTQDEHFALVCGL